MAICGIHPPSHEASEYPEVYDGRRGGTWKDCGEFRFWIQVLIL